MKVQPLDHLDLYLLAYLRYNSLNRFPIAAGNPAYDAAVSKLKQAGLVDTSNGLQPSERGAHEADKLVDNTAKIVATRVNEAGRKRKATGAEFFILSHLKHFKMDQFPGRADAPAFVSSLKILTVIGCIADVGGSKEITTRGSEFLDQALRGVQAKLPKLAHLSESPATSKPKHYSFARPKPAPPVPAGPAPIPAPQVFDPFDL
jgi:hypothetical protein